jgi:hypothetical protein
MEFASRRTLTCITQRFGVDGITFGWETVFHKKFPLQNDEKSEPARPAKKRAR